MLMIFVPWPITFQCLGLAEVEKLQTSVDNISCRSVLREERTEEQRGHEKVFVSFAVGEHACHCVKQKAAVCAWWPSELQAMRMVIEQP